MLVLEVVMMAADAQHILPQPGTLVLEDVLMAADAQYVLPP